MRGSPRRPAPTSTHAGAEASMQVEGTAQREVVPKRKERDLEEQFTACFRQMTEPRAGNREHQEKSEARNRHVRCERQEGCAQEQSEHLLCRCGCKAHCPAAYAASIPTLDSQLLDPWNKSL